MPRRIRAGLKLQTFLADARILELGCPLSVSYFNLQLTNVFTDRQNLVCNCGFAFSEFIDNVYISIRARILKLFRDSLRILKGVGLFPH
jgi:hypothetical protein